MKIVLWGATGLTGREVLNQALEGGLEVKAVARNPGLIEVEHANLSVVWGDALDPQSVEDAVARGEVVISALGSGATLMQARKPTTLYSEGFANIVAAHAQTRHPPLYCTRSGRDGARSKRAAHPQADHQAYPQS